MVGDKVTAHSKRKLPYRFHFDPDPTFRSAVGLPGGEVFVGGGILAFIDTEDPLAAVLGHEIEHIDLGQCHDRLVKILADQYLTPSQFDQLKVDDFLPGYGHDNERAADFEGTKLAIEAGYSPEGMVRLLQTIKEQGLGDTPQTRKIGLKEYSYPSDGFAVKFPSPTEPDTDSVHPDFKVWTVHLNQGPR